MECFCSLGSSSLFFVQFNQKNIKVIHVAGIFGSPRGGIEVDTGSATSPPFPNPIPNPMASVRLDTPVGRGMEVDLVATPG